MYARLRETSSTPERRAVGARHDVGRAPGARPASGTASSWRRWAPRQCALDSEAVRVVGRQQRLQRWRPAAGLVEFRPASRAPYPWPRWRSAACRRGRTPPRHLRADQRRTPSRAARAVGPVGSQARRDLPEGRAKIRQFRIRRQFDVDVDLAAAESRQSASDDMNRPQHELRQKDGHHDRRNQHGRRAEYRLLQMLEQFLPQQPCVDSDPDRGRARIGGRAASLNSNLPALSTRWP